MGRRLKRTGMAAPVICAALLALITFGCKDVLLGEIIRDEREAKRALYPEISLIVDAEDKSSGDNVHVGTTGQDNPIAKTFYIHNDGEVALSLPSLVEIGGADAGAFTLTTPPPGTVTAGGQASFVIAFESPDLGTKTASLSIENNDPDESPFTLTLTGTCVAPGTVIAPDGGELLKPGSGYNIQWSAFPGGNVTLDLYDAGTFKQNLAVNITDASPYAWPVPTNIDGTAYKIRVTSVADGALYDESDDTFSIGRLSSLAVAGGDNYYKPGEILDLTWDTTLKSTETVTIALYKSGSFQQNLASGVANDGSQQVTVPAGASGSGYTLRISANGNSAIYADSGTFTLGAITVTVPSASGIVWRRDTNYTIQWNSGGLGGYVAISYLKGAAETTIDGNDPNDGSFSWTTLEGLAPGNDYKIKVTFLSDTGIYDTSDNAFTVWGEELAAPTFSLAGGYFTANQSVTLTKPGTAPVGTLICYTTDGSTPDPGVHGTWSSPTTITVSAFETTIKAISVLDFYDPTDPPAEQTYYIPYKYAGQFTDLKNPRGVCYHDDLIWIADYGNKRIIAVNNNLTAVSGKSLTTPGTPYDLGTDGAGSLWVSEYNPTYVNLYDTSDVPVAYANARASGMTVPWGVHRYDYLYVVDTSANQVRRHSYEVNLPFHSYLDQNAFSNPIDFDRLRIRHGVLPPFTYTTYFYVSDNGTNKIRRYDSSGSYLSQFSAGDPRGIVCIDGSDFLSPGYVIVADYGNNRVQVYTAGGAFFTQFGSYGSGNGLFNGPMGVVLDNLSNLYVTDYYNNRLQKFTPNN
jgi:hypothetical protein